MACRVVAQEPFRQEMSMIDRCANSQCDKTLHYFREGIIYAVETRRKHLAVESSIFGSTANVRKHNQGSKSRYAVAAKRKSQT
jgi:hypothetical protein